MKRIDMIKKAVEDVPQIRKCIRQTLLNMKQDKEDTSTHHTMALANLASICLRTLTNVYVIANEENTEHDWQEVRKRDD